MSVPRSPHPCPNHPRDAGGRVLRLRSPYRWVLLPHGPGSLLARGAVPPPLPKSCSPDFSWLSAAPHAVLPRGLLMGRGGSASRDLLTAPGALLRGSPTESLPRSPVSSLPEGTQILVLCTGQREASHIWGHPGTGSSCGRVAGVGGAAWWGRGWRCVVGLPLRPFRRGMLFPRVSGTGSSRPFFMNQTSRGRMNSPAYPRELRTSSTPLFLSSLSSRPTGDNGAQSGLPRRMGPDEDSSRGAKRTRE